MSLTSFKRFLFPDIRETFARFPAVISAALLLTLLLMLQNHHGRMNIENQLIRLAAFTVALLSIRLFIENHGYGRDREIGLGVLVAALLVIWPWNFPFLLPGLLLFIMVAPYLLKKEDEDAACHFNCAVGLSVLFAGLTTVVLCGGISGTLASIGYLFETRIGGKYYADIWMLGFGVFAVIYALSGIPQDYTMPDRAEYPKGVRFLLLYILCPLMIVYVLILYAYFAKIITQWQLPKGNLSTMIIAYGTLGVFLHLFVHPMREKSHVLMQIFHRYFYYALVVPVIFLFIAIYTRVDQYGLTEQRYALYLFAAWLGFSSLYVIITRRERLKPIVLSLAVMLILASFGPWGAKGLSVIDQTIRLEALLGKNGMLVNGKLVGDAKNKVSSEDMTRIYNLVYYLTARDGGRSIRQWMPEDSEALKQRGLSSHDVLEEIGLNEAQKQARSMGGPFFNLSVSNIHQHNTFIHVKGYDFVSPQQLSVYRYSRQQSFNTPQGPLNITLENGYLRIIAPQGQVLSFDLSTWMENFRKNHPDVDTTKVKAEDMILEMADGDFAARLELQNITGTWEEKRPLVAATMFRLLLRLPAPVVNTAPVKP